MFIAVNTLKCKQKYYFTIITVLSPTVMFCSLSRQQANDVEVRAELIMRIKSKRCNNKIIPYLEHNFFLITWNLLNNFRGLRCNSYETTKPLGTYA